MVDVAAPLTRPPTPPRTASRMLSEKDRMEESPVPVQTPNDSPVVQTASTGAPSSRQSKRVNFSPWPNFIKPPSFTNAKSKALLPSNDRKPTRSILKATNSPGPVISPAGVVSYTPETFAMLLESVTQQLAGETTSSRIDAYTQLFNALRAYEKLPTEEEIVRKLGLIAQFIQRDVGRDLTKGGPLDTNIVIQALKLSVVLVWHPQISPELPDDFKLFLVEHSVSCLEDGKLPKSVMTHYLTVLSTQKFSTKIITSARVIRILEMLNALTDKVKGNSVVSQRLVIYERLFEVSKSTFIAHSSLWVDHLISGLLHQIKNVRLSALELGFNTYMASGANSALSKTIRDMFDRTLANNRKLVSEISERMSRMMANPESGEHVPQIWGVITLLLRNKRFNIYQWQHFKEWVLVLQKCFNCSDPEIKSKAICNWNRFVLVANINETTSRPLLQMLSKPILSQFERRKHDKPGAQPSQLAVSSYYNLLYYAFRPDAPHQQFDNVWEEYIASPSSKTFSSVPSLSDRLAQALSALLWSSQPLKAWSENRVIESKRMAAEELPPLDSKWVRSRIPAVLKVFEDIFKSSVWKPEMEKSNIAAAWISLSQALAFAASKEITPSPESMQTVAHVLGLLQRLWNEGPSSLNAVESDSKDTFFERFRFLSTTMIVALGSIPFTEKLLLKTANSTYQATTPTHRHSNVNNNPESPILHLLRLVAVVSGPSGPTPAYLRLINGIVEVAYRGKPNRGSRLDILRQCATLYSESDDLHLGFGKFAEIIWTSAAELAADCVQAMPTEPAREREGSTSRDYDNMISILSTGLKVVPDSLIWGRLMAAFVRLLKVEAGDQAVLTKALEPYAGLLMGLPIAETYLRASSIIKNSVLLDCASFDGELRDRNPAGTPASFPPVVIEMARRVLSETDALADFSQSGDCAIFIGSISSLLRSGITAFNSFILDQLQVSIGPYVKEVSGSPEGDESVLVSACRDISPGVLDTLKKLNWDPSMLNKFEPIICSGLGSSHMPTAKLYQGLFDPELRSQTPFVYPASISHALRDLEARIASENSPPPAQPPQSNPETEKDQDHGSTRIAAEIFKKLTPRDASAKSRIDFILDAPTDRPAVESTSAVAAESAVSALQETPKDPQQAPVQEAQTSHEEVSSGKETAARHQEMFSMIDNLRSSSPPTATPRELGFMTPPHLRTLRNTESGSATPQTPTIPAVPADNEDGFLGSSPTPAIRGRSSSAAPAIPPPVSAVGDSMEIDPPSSPPERASQDTDSRQSSPSKLSAKEKSARNRKRNRSRRSKTSTPNKEKPAGVQSQSKQDEPNESEVTGEAQPNTSRRLRSADKSSATNEDTQDEQSQQTPKPMGTEPIQNTAADTSKTDNNGANPEQPDMPVDEASEDTDTQATSQLEHDLVYAVDLGSDTIDNQAAEMMDKAAVTRKRKREGENWTTLAKKERRRSSRISSTPAEPAEDDQSQPAAAKKQKISPPTEETQPSSPAKPAAREESQSTRSKEQKARAPSQESALSPASTPAKKRKLETEEPVPETPKPEKSKKNKPAEKPNTQDSQTRRSGRISGVPAPDIPEETPPPRKTQTPRPSSARKQNKKQRNRKEKRRSQSAVPSTASSGEVLNSQISTADEEGSAQHAEPYGSAQTGESELQSIQETSLPKEPEDVQMGDVPNAEQEPAMAEVPTGAEAQPTAEQPEPIEAVPEPENQTLSEPVQQPQPEPEPEKQPEHEMEPAPQPSQDAQISISLRSLIDQVKLSSLDRNAVREMDELLFDFRVEMHEALRRHRDNADGASQ